MLKQIAFSGKLEVVIMCVVANASPWKPERVTICVHNLGCDGPALIAA